MWPCRPPHTVSWIDSASSPSSISRVTKLAIGSGFLEVKEAGRVIILCDRAITPEEVDRTAVTKRLEEVKAEINRLNNERGAKLNAAMSPAMPETGVNV